LSLLLILSLASRVFLRVLRFPSSAKIDISKFQFDHGRGPQVYYPASRVSSFITLFVNVIKGALCKAQLVVTLITTLPPVGRSREWWPSVSCFQTLPQSIPS
jgi:hypothetical protein